MSVLMLLLLLLLLLNWVGRSTASRSTHHHLSKQVVLVGIHRRRGLLSGRLLLLLLLLLVTRSSRASGSNSSSIAQLSQPLERCGRRMLMGRQRWSASNLMLAFNDLLQPSRILVYLLLGLSFGHAWSGKRLGKRWRERRRGRAICGIRTRREQRSEMLLLLLKKQK